MKRIVIADVKSYNSNGRSTGHYFSVSKNYLDLYQGICPVIVAGGPIYQNFIEGKNYFCLPYDFVVGRNWVKNKWNVLMNCRFLFRRTTPDDIIVLQQSGLSTAIMGIALFATIRNNIYVIAYDTDAVSSSFKRLIYKMAKKKICGIICSHKSVAESYKLPCCIVPDYIYPFWKYRRAPLSFQNKKYDIAIVGIISWDKGVVEAAEFLSKTKYKVLLAGKAADNQLALKLKEICDSSKNIELHLGFIENEIYYNYIREARFCLLNYRGTYEERSSGVALDIIFNNTPILGRKCKALSFVEKFNVGYLYDDISKVDFNVIMDACAYDILLTNISKYLSKNESYRNQVAAFLRLK